MQVATNVHMVSTGNGNVAKETGVIFSPEMSRALVAGTKTMTRRGRGLRKINESPDDWAMSHFTDDLWWAKKTGEDREIIHCPYGKAGDKIWARETFGQLHPEDGGGYVYKASVVCDAVEDLLDQPWTSPLYMPRKASRFVGELTEVRLERLNEITEEDAQSEGACRAWSDWADNYWEAEPETEKMVGVFATYRTGFESIWVGLYNKASWDKNPWVWVLKFTKI